MELVAQLLVMLYELPVPRVVPPVPEFKAKLAVNE
jgi:hypothetical protein